MSTQKPDNLICLWAPSVGYVINSECETSDKAERLLADRKTNGEAFDHEKVVITSRVRYAKAHRSTDMERNPASYTRDELKLLLEAVEELPIRSTDSEDRKKAIPVLRGKIADQVSAADNQS